MRTTDEAKLNWWLFQSDQIHSFNSAELTNDYTDYNVEIYKHKKSKERMNFLIVRKLLNHTNSKASPVPVIFQKL